MKVTIKLSNSLVELTRLHEQLEVALRRWRLPDTVRLQVNLIIDELFTNTVTYGYADDGEHLVLVTIEVKDDRIVVRMIDDGHKFDPTEPRHSGNNAPGQGEEPGGLGIFLVHHYMDDIRYSRRFNKNIITMVKKLEAQ